MRGSVVNTRFRGMKTSSSHSCASSSSKRLLRGGIKGLACRAAVGRAMMRTPGACTGTIIHSQRLLPGGSSSRPVISTSSTKGVLVCMDTLPLTTMPSVVSWINRIATRLLGSSRSRWPMSGPPEANVRKRPLRANAFRYASAASISWGD
jgi:hypothetical protein